MIHQLVCKDSHKVVKSTFTAGDPAVPLDDTKPMTFEDGQSTKTVPGVGEYSINSDGSITFTPDKKYVGYHQIQ